MERRTNPNLHLICGKCGCGTMLSFKVDLEHYFEEEVCPSVIISCTNCGTLTGLDEEIEDKTNWKQQIERLQKQLENEQYRTKILPRREFRGKRA